MKTAKKVYSFAAIIALVLAALQAPVKALTASPLMAVPVGLSLLEMKMTGDEFVLLQNNSDSDINDLSSYWLNVYNNVNPLAAGVSSSTQQLPTAGLKVGQTLLLSSAPMQTCGAAVAGKLSLSLTDSGGFLQLSQMTLNAKGAVIQSAGDVVSWSSSANGIIQSVPSSTKDPKAAYFRYLNGSSYAWQLADLDTTNLCQLNIVVAGGLGSSSAVTPLTLAATSPPATILGSVTAGTDGASSTAVLPVADVGLNAPQLSELLPNPIGTGNDATDEFIELYNPNAVSFDLTGFTLESGATTTHDYVFPAGSSLAPNSFKAFYASDTKLSLSNTSGQVNLLDPFGNVISSSGLYEKAKDGYSWAVAKNQWYYTTQPTPGAANVIKQPPVKKTAAAKTKTKKASTSKKASASHKTTLTSANASSDTFGDDEQGNIVHTWVLALVGGCALLYGAYEYRRDITNRLYWLGTKLRFRRPLGSESARPGSDRTSE